MSKKFSILLDSISLVNKVLARIFSIEIVQKKLYEYMIETDHGTIKMSHQRIYDKI